MNLSQPTEPTQARRAKRAISNFRSQTRFTNAFTFATDLWFNQKKVNQTITPL